MRLVSCPDLLTFSPSGLTTQHPNVGTRISLAAEAHTTQPHAGQEMSSLWGSAQPMSSGHGCVNTTAPRLTQVVGGRVDTVRPVGCIGPGGPSRSGGQLPTVIQGLIMHPFLAALASLSPLATPPPHHGVSWDPSFPPTICLLISESASGRMKLRPGMPTNSNSKKNTVTAIKIVAT